MCWILWSSHVAFGNRYGLSLCCPLTAYSPLTVYASSSPLTYCASFFTVQDPLIFHGQVFAVLWLLWSGHLSFDSWVCLLFCLTGVLWLLAHAGPLTACGIALSAVVCYMVISHLCFAFRCYGGLFVLWQQRPIYYQLPFCIILWPLGRPVTAPCQSQQCLWHV